MRFLPTRVHAVIDYLWGIALAGSPFLLGFAGTNAGFVAMVAGAFAIIYSLLTRYELGLAPVLPIPAHLGLDALAGGALALLPLVLPMPGAAAWVFGAFGVFAVVAAFVTETDTREMVGYV